MLKSPSTIQDFKTEFLEQRSGQVTIGGGVDVNAQLSFNKVRRRSVVSNFDEPMQLNNTGALETQFLDQNTEGEDASENIEGCEGIVEATIKSQHNGKIKIEVSQTAVGTIETP